MDAAKFLDGFLVLVILFFFTLVIIRAEDAYMAPVHACEFTISSAAMGWDGCALFTSLAFRKMYFAYAVNATYDCMKTTMDSKGMKDAADMSDDALLAAFDEISMECRDDGAIPTVVELVEAWESNEKAAVLAKVETYRYNWWAHYVAYMEELVKIFTWFLTVLIP